MGETSGPTMKITVNFEGKSKEISVDPTETIHDSLEDISESLKIKNIDICDLYYHVISFSAIDIIVIVKLLTGKG
jgi:hypothetical protein